MIEEDHAVSVSACDGCILPNGTQSCLTRCPESVEGRVHSTKSVVVVPADSCSYRGTLERSKITGTHRAGPRTG